MIKRQINNLLKIKIGFSNDIDIEEYRKIYYSIVNEPEEHGFYNSMIDWFFDGNAPYYDKWLRKNWR